MTRFSLALLFFGGAVACNMDDDKESVPPDADADTDADSDADSDTDTDSDTDSDTDADAEIRILHLGQGAPAVDIYAIETGTTPDVNAPTATLSFAPDNATGNGTGYVSVPSNINYDVIIQAEDADPTMMPVLTVSDVDVMPATRYAAAAIGNLTPGVALTVGLFVEDSATITSGQAKLNIIHAGAGIGTVDVINTADDSVLADNIAFGEAIPAELEIPPGTYNIAVDTTPDDGPDADVPFQVTVEADTYYAAYAVNTADAGAALAPVLVVHVGGTADAVTVSPTAP